MSIGITIVAGIRIFINMPTIKFSGITDVATLERVFRYIKVAKQRDGIEEGEIRALLGALVKTKFLNLSEIDLSDPASLPAGGWDFESWVDALNSADLSYDSIDCSGNVGVLGFAQNSWPSGGIGSDRGADSYF